MRGVRIDHVLCATDVICCVIDSEDFMIVDAIVFKQNRTRACLDFIGASSVTTRDVSQDSFGEVSPQVR
jgi:hypothetical protein